jgi:TolB-like protein
MASRFSIAVLPFANLGGDSRQDYLADGITDSLTTNLSRALPGSFVVSRDTAFTYKGRIGDVRRRATCGSVRKASGFQEPPGMMKAS